MIGKNFLLTTMLLKILKVFCALVLISFGLTIWLPFLEAMQVVFGSFFILFMPGFIVVSLFFPKRDVIYGVLLSFIFSITLVFLLVFYFYYLGIQIHLISVLIEVTFFIFFLCLVARYWNRTAVDK